MISPWPEHPREALGRARILESRALAPLIGLATTAAFLWIWAGAWRIAPYADESSYLLQAKIFASGHWSMPSPPLPEFFEQAYVFVTPRYSSIYFPGHSLALVPGIWLGFPPLVPLIELGMTGSLLFLLARGVAGSAAGLLSWVLWLTAPIQPSLRPSYFSESTTGMLWLAAWLAYRRWKGRGSRFALVLCAAMIGWGALTRPLTMFAFAVPLAVAAVIHAARNRRWADLAVAAAAAALVLAVLPLWGLETTGNPTRSPYFVYMRQYTPWMLHLREPPVDEVARRHLPADLQRMMDILHKARRSFDATPRLKMLGRRCLRIGAEMWGARSLPGSPKQAWQKWRILLLPFFVVGCVFVGREGRLALMTAVCLILAYLPFWQGNDNWMAYYLELQPVLAFLTAVGLEKAMHLVIERRRNGGEESPKPGSRGATLVLTGVLLVSGSTSLWIARREKAAEAPGQRAFDRALAALPGSKAVVFVRYGPRHNASFNVHFPLIHNDPDLPKARVWIVYDRGSENACLMAIARDRLPYLYDEDDETMTRMGREAVSANERRPQSPADRPGDVVPSPGTRGAPISRVLQSASMMPARSHP